MTAEHRRYFAIEMSVAAVINAVLSIAFALFVFGGTLLVPVLGWGGLVFDALPQSFMVALMSCLVPTLLSRRRLSSRQVEPMSATRFLPGRLATRAVSIAITASLVAVALQFITLPLFGASWTLTAVLVFKTIYGAALGAAVAALAIRVALGERRGDES